MNTKRQCRKNEIMVDLKNADNSIKRSEDTIIRLKSSHLDPEYVKNETAKLKENIDEKTILMVKLKEEDEKIDSGELDDQLKEEYEKNKKIVDKNDDEKQKKIIAKKQENKTKKNNMEKQRKEVYLENRSQRWDAKGVDRELQYYYKMIDSVPGYMLKNLSEMPNNKGYIWRNIRMYGDLPSEKGPIILFEKLQNAVLVIHEYTDKTYTRHEKVGQNRKVCVYSGPRKVKKCGISLLDCVVKN